MSDRQRTGARSVLVSVVSLLFILAALQGLAVIRAGGWSALAQTGTPSPGQTTSAPPKIEFLNPSPGTSTVVADGQDSDTAYHINAWVQSVPSAPTVEFQLIQGSDPAVLLGTGTRHGDAFDLFWSISDNVADGDYTLKAVLKNNGAEVDSDEQTITINRDDNDLPPLPDPEDAAATIEIDDPNNGGPVGIYTSPGEEPTKTFVIAYTASANVVHFDSYYSVSSPGTEPEWTSCGADDEVPSGTDNANETTSGLVRCTVAAEDSPTRVTAVALVPTSNPIDPVPAEDQFPGAADAHRVIGYNQEATTVSVTPETQNVTDLAKCALLTATVLDQNGEIIAGHNVDVHAAGPSDNLNFDTGGEFSDASQAPDQGGHGTAEEATECDADGVPTAGGTQGEHDDPAGNDRKHIESADDTGDDGTYRFALSTDIAGGTQVTAWADKDGDDQFCATEPFDAASIGWQQAPPTPGALPFDEQTCSASPSPTGTSTGSPTGTGTGPEPDRTVTLAASKNKVVAGKTVTLSGQVTAAETSCEDNELVEIHRRIHGKQNFQPFAEDATDANGGFQTSILVKKSADYMAVLNAHDDCSEATSNDETVLAKVKLFLAVEDKTVNRGDTVRIKVAIRPQHDGDRVILQVKKGKRWVKFDVDDANKRSIAKFRFPANWDGTKVFRAKWPKQHADHETGKSRRAEIRTN
jgi:hypothetical protein